MLSPPLGRRTEPEALKFRESRIHVARFRVCALRVLGRGASGAGLLDEHSRLEGLRVLGCRVEKLDLGLGYVDI